MDNPSNKIYLKQFSLLVKNVETQIRSICGDIIRQLCDMGVIVAVHFEDPKSVVNNCKELLELYNIFFDDLVQSKSSMSNQTEQADTANSEEEIAS